MYCRRPTISAIQPTNTTLLHARRKTAHLAGPRIAIGLLVALIFAAVAPAQQLKIGNVTIWDNQGRPGDDPRDTNPRPNIIEFNNNDRGGGNFPMPDGYNVSGRVDLGRRLLALPQVVRLTQFQASRPGVVGDDALKIEFWHTFGVPPAPALAMDGIEGDFINPAGFLSGSGLSFQGFVNGIPILNAQVFNVGGGGSPQHIEGIDGPVPAFFGPGWRLLGVLEFTLNIRGPGGDMIFLPNSAEVGIVPEGSTVFLLAIGAALLLIRRTQTIM